MAKYLFLDDLTLKQKLTYINNLFDDQKLNVNRDSFFKRLAREFNRSVTELTKEYGLEDSFVCNLSDQDLQNPDCFGSIVCKLIDYQEQMLQKESVYKIDPQRSFPTLIDDLNTYIVNDAINNAIISSFARNYLNSNQIDDAKKMSRLEYVHSIAFYEVPKLDLMIKLDDFSFKELTTKDGFAFDLGYYVKEDLQRNCNVFYNKELISAKFEPFLENKMIELADHNEEFRKRLETVVPSTYNNSDKVKCYCNRLYQQNCRALTQSFIKNRLENNVPLECFPKTKRELERIVIDSITI